MFEHAVLVVSFQQQRLHRDGWQVGHDDAQLLWDALSVRDIRHHEQRHAGEQRHGLCNVSLRRFVEVEHYRQVVALPQFVPEGIEHLLSLWREAAEDQHYFGSDGMDDVADFLIVQQQVNELRDLNIVDRDLRFALPCNNQILLLSFFV